MAMTLWLKWKFKKYGKILNGYVNIGKGTTLQGHISIDAQMARI